MKAVSSLSALFLAAILSSCAGNLNDLDRRGLKGKVKATNEFQCDATYENEKWVAGTDCANGYRVVEYDEEGNYIQAMSMSDCGDTTNLSTVRRENGELVEESYFTRFQMTPKHSRMVLFSRTVMDRVSEDQINYEVWQEDRLTFEGSTYYDSKGRIERQVQVVNNREVIVHHIYEKNLLVEMYQQELDGSRSATQQYEYSEFDDHGNWTLRLVYNGEEKITPEMAITRVLEYY
ncbi:MAG: hypothetical protein P1P86_08655 [Bacteroidales bacterium]|nr:hypothetical protein [Bacteroidales bacterium]